MGQRVDQRRVDREYRVEEVRQANTVSLGDEPQELSVSVERPRTAAARYLQSGLVMPVEKLVGDLPRRVLVGKLKRLRPIPLHADDRDESVG